MHIDDNDLLAKKEMELRVQNFERSCGWRLLMNEHIVLHRGKDSIYVAGTENYDKPKRTQVAQALYGIKPGQFVLMLQHIPTQWEEMLPSTINEKHGSRDSVLVAVSSIPQPDSAAPCLSASEPPRKSQSSH